MVDPVRARRWMYRALFVTAAGAVLFLRLLPLSTQAPTWPPAHVLDLPGPDLLLALCMAWVLRRPDFVPVLLIAAVFLVEDMFAMRPPGLWPALVVLVTEFLRSREALLRDLPFPAEWASVSALMVALFLLNRLALWLVLVPQPGLGFALVQLASTIAAYPLAVLVSQSVFGLRRPSLAESDTWGPRK